MRFATLPLGATGSVLRVVCWPWQLVLCGIPLRLPLTCAAEHDELLCQLFHCNHPHARVYHSSVDSFEWTCHAPFSLLTASPPCPAFATLRGSPGQASDQADGWYQLISILRTVQPGFLLLENVPGAVSKLHQIRHAMSLAGFQMASSTEIDVGNYSCGTRLRWLFLWKRTAIPILKEGGVVLPRLANPSVRLADAVLSANLVGAELSIPAKELAVLCDPRLDDPRGSNKTFQGVWESRIVTLDGSPSAFTHSYPRNTSLPKNLLKRRGLHLQVLNDGSITRYFSGRYFVSTVFRGCGFLRTPLGRGKR